MQAEVRKVYWQLAGGFGAYAGVVGGGAAALDGGRSTGALRWLVGASSVAVGAYVLAVVLRAGRRSKELERVLFSESSSIAFFVTMLFALTYALLESWVELPRVTAWATWAVGMGSWAVLSLVLRRRMS